MSQKCTACDKPNKQLFTANLFLEGERQGPPQLICMDCVRLKGKELREEHKRRVEGRCEQQA